MTQLECRDTKLWPVGFSSFGASQCLSSERVCRWKRRSRERERVLLFLLLMAVVLRRCLSSWYLLLSRESVQHRNSYSLGSLRATPAYRKLSSCSCFSSTSRSLAHKLHHLRCSTTNPSFSDFSSLSVFPAATQIKAVVSVSNTPILSIKSSETKNLNSFSSSRRWCSCRRDVLRSQFCNLLCNRNIMCFTRVKTWVKILFETWVVVGLYSLLGMEIQAPLW